MSRISRVVADYRQRLAAREAVAEQALEEAYQNVLAAIEPQLDALYSLMTDELGNNKKLSLNWLYEANRLETIKKLINGQIDQYGALARTITGRMQQGGMQLGIDASIAMLGTTVPPGVNWAFGIPDPNAIKNLVGALQPGSPLYDLFAGFGLQAATDVGQALIVGLTLGHGPREIARSVQTALGTSRARALTIVRTEQLRAYRGAAQETYKKNADIMAGWRWTASLSSRTCAACLAMDGKIFPVDREFGSHPNCRCTPVPVTKSWKEVLGPLGIDTSSIPDSRPQFQSGSDWLDGQSDTTQRSILGAKFDIWKNNVISLSDIVKHSYSDDWGHSINEKSLKALVK